MGKIATQIVPIRLTPTEIEELDRIRKVGGFESRSGVMRAGLGMLMDKWGTLKQTDAQIEKERYVCRPRAATMKPRDIAEDLRKPTVSAEKVRNTKSPSTRRKKGAKS